jgi:hypothetical protein
MPRPADAAIRGALVAVAVAISAYATSAQREEDRCDEAGATVVRETQGATSAGARAEAVDTLLAGGCRDSRPALVASGALARSGRDETAARLARAVVDREPENATAWFVAAAALREGDPADARAAGRRAARLSPLAARSR